MTKNELLIHISESTPSNMANKIKQLEQRIAELESK